MNKLTADARLETIRAALGGVASQLTPAGVSSWRLTLDNGAPHAVTAGTKGDWLVLEADGTGHAPGPELFWGALGRNGSLGGLAKWVAAPDGSVQLRAELPVLEGVDILARVRETCHAFEAVWMREGQGASPDASPAPDAAPVDLKALCSEAGWPPTERGGRSLAVELEVAGGFCQALLLPARQGVHVRCEVATLDSLAEECRPAVGGFLLSLSGLVRMGRASLNTKGASPVAQFEVAFESAPVPVELSSALECLSVACSLCGEEIKTLQVPAIAERYLALRGWSADVVSRQDERK